MSEFDALDALEKKIDRLLDRYAQLQGRASTPSGDAKGTRKREDGDVERLTRELAEARRLSETVRGRVAALVERISKIELGG